MKRWAVIGLLAAAVLGLSGCPEPSPPAGWKAPVITSLDISPSTIEAGSEFTITVTATDDKLVQGLGVHFYVDPVRSDRWIPCTGEQPAPAPTVTGTLTCTMPTYAPNGSWTVLVLADDGEVPHWQGAGYGSREAHITVTGGTDDREAPVIEPLVFDPTVLTVGTPFTVATRVTDANLHVDNEPQYLTFLLDGATLATYCPGTAVVPPTSTAQEWSYSCPAPTTPGRYLVQIGFQDLIGNLGLSTQWVDVT